MKITVKHFAGLREIIGSNEMEIEMKPNSSVSDLLVTLINRYPSLDEWQAYIRVAVNHEYVSNDYILCDHDEAAIIPPVSGG